MMNQRVIARGLLVMLGVSLAGAASGQTTAQAQAGCRKGAASALAVAPPGGCSVPDQAGSVSSRLSQSHGVITPPSTDPTMAKQPPITGPQSMPVIAPPGSPGGDPNLVPK